MNGYCAHKVVEKTGHRWVGHHRQNPLANPAADLIDVATGWLAKMLGLRSAALMTVSARDKRIVPGYDGYGYARACDLTRSPSSEPLT